MGIWIVAVLGGFFRPPWVPRGPRRAGSTSAGTRLYRAGSGGGPHTVYARLASLEPLCEICHGVHFLYAFDDTGTIRGFQGVHVTK